MRSGEWLVASESPHTGLDQVAVCGRLQFRALLADEHDLLGPHPLLGLIRDHYLVFTIGTVSPPSGVLPAMLEGSVVVRPQLTYDFIGH